MARVGDNDEELIVDDRHDGAPFVLTQPTGGVDAPWIWYEAQQNMRCYGAGLLGQNQGYREVFFQ